MFILTFILLKFKVKKVNKITLQLKLEKRRQKQHLKYSTNVNLASRWVFYNTFLIMFHNKSIVKKCRVSVHWNAIGLLNLNKYRKCISGLLLTSHALLVLATWCNTSQMLIQLVGTKWNQRKLTQPYHLVPLLLTEGRHLDSWYLQNKATHSKTI